MLLLWAGAYTSPAQPQFPLVTERPRRPLEDDEDALMILLAWGFPL